MGIVSSSGQNYPVMGRGNGIISPSVNSSDAAPTPLLLDTYPGASLALSLRKLRLAYSGDAIRVRRDSDDAEMDIGFVGVDLDTASLLSFCGAGSGFVKTIYGQDLVGIDATQIANDSQPRIVNTGTLETSNGKPTISMNGNTDEWFLKLPTGLLYNAANVSFFAVWNIPYDTEVNAGVFGAAEVSGQGFEILQQLSLLRINGAIRNISAGDPYRLWNDATQSLTTVIGNETLVAAYKDGSAVTLDDSSAMPALDFNGEYAIGAYSAPFFDISGNIQEIVVYEADQTSNREAIEAEILDYYS